MKAGSCNLDDSIQLFYRIRSQSVLISIMVVRAQCRECCVLLLQAAELPTATVPLSHSLSTHCFVHENGNLNAQVPETIAFYISIEFGRDTGSNTRISSNYSKFKPRFARPYCNTLSNALLTCKTLNLYY